jgi:acyl carrier protein
MADETLNRLDGLIRELDLCTPTPLHPDLSLRQGLLLGPLDLVDLAGLIGREFGIEAPPEVVRVLPSVGDLCAFIESRQVQTPVVLRPARE